MTNQIVVVSWTMRRNPDAWGRLEQIREQHDAQIALVQGPAHRPRGTGGHPDAADRDKFRLTAHRNRQRRFASGSRSGPGTNHEAHDFSPEVLQESSVNWRHRQYRCAALTFRSRQASQTLAPRWM